MVQMEMGIDDDVDVFGIESRVLEVSQVVGIEHVEIWEQGPVLVIARAGVDHHDCVAQLDEVVVDGEDQIGTVCRDGRGCIGGSGERELLLADGGIPIVRWDGPHGEFSELCDGRITDGECVHSRRKRSPGAAYSR
ncbi:hypothetical protein MSTE_05034 [Mycobacteroides stephanolepidis]|uniref:Uncharacterized protein n=1 Tax=[Mycobacterium] stephanolepidis TaxID=1520670 RepID=A0A1Z4F501_9MYCO|nr:hypothetical protein MSTE_05034 [[Mycobacterium] stephanolepidis]